jgi:hypothetical protein
LKKLSKLKKQSRTLAAGLTLGGACAIVIAIAGPAWGLGEGRALQGGATKASTSTTSAEAQPDGEDGQTEIPSYFRPDELSRSGLDLATTSHLGKVGEADYWVVTDRSGQLCLVGGFQGTDWYAAAACALPADVEKRGLGLQIAAVGRASEAYYSSALDFKPEASAFVEIAPGFFGLDPTTSAVERARLAGNTHGLIVITDPVGTLK